MSICGGKAEINYEHIPGDSKGCWAQIICEKCHGRSAGTWENTYSAAKKKEVKKWNRRVGNEEMEVQDGTINRKNTETR